MSGPKKLALNEIEITWLNGTLERIQTQGLAVVGMAVILSLDDHKVIIPLASMRKARVLSI